jgi:hypothetical protein
MWRGPACRNQPDPDLVIAKKLSLGTKIAQNESLPEKRTEDWMSKIAVLFRPPFIISLRRKDILWID